MDPSTPDIPPIYTRNVLRAIAYLQKGDTIFIPADAIIQKVILQMGRSRMLETVRNYVLKSLTSLTQLGILTRSPSTENGFYQFPADNNNFLPHQTKNKNSKRNRAKNPKSIYNVMNGRCQMPKPRVKCSFKAKHSPCNSPYNVMCTDCRMTVVSCVKAYKTIQTAAGSEFMDNTSNSSKPELASKIVQTGSLTPDEVVMVKVKKEKVHDNDELDGEEPSEALVNYECYVFNSPIGIVEESDTSLKSFY